MVLTLKGRDTLPGVMYGSSSGFFMLVPCHGLPGTNSSIISLILLATELPTLVLLLLVELTVIGELALLGIPESLLALLAMSLLLVLLSVVVEVVLMLSPILLIGAAPELTAGDSLSLLPGD